MCSVKSGFVLYDDSREPVFVRSKKLFAPQKSLEYRAITGNADMFSDKLYRSITRISYVKYEFMKDSFYYISINAEKDNGKFFKDTYNEAVQKIFEKYGEIIALYIDGKTVFSNSTEIIVEEKSTQNLDVSYINFCSYTDLFCNQRYIDYVALICVKIRKYGDEEKH